MREGTRKVLSLARQLVAHGWTQGAEVDAKASGVGKAYSTVGAIRTACDVYGYKTKAKRGGNSDRFINGAFKTLAGQVKGSRRLVDGTGATVLAAWNDDAGRSKADVLATFDAVLGRW